MSKPRTFAMDKLDPMEREDVFFYATRDVKYYDLLEELAQPYIDLIHDTMVDLMAYSLRDACGDRYADPRVLIIGSGTGAELFRVLDRFPRAQLVAIDFSPQMNAELRRKFTERRPRQDFDRRINLIEADFFSDRCQSEKLLRDLPSRYSGLFDVVIAGFFLHHYNESTKALFYRRAAALLRAPGFLVHGDLFNFQSDLLSAFAHDFGERWIRKQMSDPDPTLRAKFDAVGSEIHRLREEWITHWNATHQYAPIESAERRTGSAPDLGQAAIALREGFSDIGCPFRLWEAAILWARK